MPLWGVIVEEQGRFPSLSFVKFSRPQVMLFEDEFQRLSLVFTFSLLLVSFSELSELKRRC